VKEKERCPKRRREPRYIPLEIKIRREREEESKGEYNEYPIRKRK